MEIQVSAADTQYMQSVNEKSKYKNVKTSGHICAIFLLFPLID